MAPRIGPYRSDDGREVYTIFEPTSNPRYWIRSQDWRRRGNIDRFVVKLVYIEGLSREEIHRQPAITVQPFAIDVAISDHGEHDVTDPGDSKGLHVDIKCQNHGQRRGTVSIGKRSYRDVSRAFTDAEKYLIDYRDEIAAVWRGKRDPRTLPDSTVISLG
ncbi:hypothetical protein [Halorussus halobius]|uniref:hypothetical protein n=1 Tax=Halorussus halobius TaxID=1710537 RepID=UPI001092CDCF|nr:hypothetical protein [Halorussus halobius]